MSESPAFTRRPVVCAGAVHWDLIAHADRPIRPDTSTPARLSQTPGGVATNVARALARLGAAPHLIGVLGDDPAGNALAERLSHEEIRQHLTRIAGAVTGHYLALHNPDGSLPAACIDDHLLADVPPEIFAQALGEAQSGRDADICFLDANLSTAQAEALIRAVSVETLVTADTVSAAKAPRLLPLLPSIDLLFANRSEAAALLEADGSQTGATSSALAEGLLDLGCAAVILTEGSDGVWFAEQGGDVTHLAALPVTVTDVTGAGDALIAGTLAGLNRGLPLRDAVPCGLRAAAIALQAVGAAPATLTWGAVATPAA